MKNRFEWTDAGSDSSLTETFGEAVRRFGDVALDGLRKVTDPLRAVERPEALEPARIALIAKVHPEDWAS